MLFKNKKQTSNQEEATNQSLSLTSFKHVLQLKRSAWNFFAQSHKNCVLTASCLFTLDASFSASAQLLFTHIQSYFFYHNQFHIINLDLTTSPCPFLSRAFPVPDKCNIYKFDCLDVNHSILFGTESAEDQFEANQSFTKAKDPIAFTVSSSFFFLILFRMSPSDKTRALLSESSILSSTISN